MEITGQGGSLRWGYLHAATLSGWTITKTDNTWTLSGVVGSMDTFRVAQRPLVFSVPHRSWCWPIEALQITDGRLTACLGPQES